VRVRDSEIDKNEIDRESKRERERKRDSDR